MLQPVSTTSQLFTRPGIGLALGPFLTLLFYPLTGLKVSAWIGLAVGFLMFLQLSYATWYSVYGSALGLTSSLVGTVFMSTLAGGSCAVLLFLTGHQHLKAWALTGSLAMTAFACLIGARRVWVALQRDGHNDAWFREAVNLKQGWVIEVVLTGQGHWSGFWTSPSIIGALAVNVVALMRAQGWSDLQLALLAGPAMNITTAWIGWAISGPMLARALYLRQLERQLGITFVHPRLDEIQALRSRWFFTRWLMPKRPS